MTARSRLLLVAAGATLLASPPAVAAPTPMRAPVTVVDCVKPEVRGTTARSAGGGQIQRERDTRGVVADTEIPADSNVQASAGFTATVPVWFHVIAASTSPRDGWVSDRQVTDQIAVLNKAYGGGYGGVDSGFRFRLAGVTRTVNAEWFAMETFASELAAKRALRRGDSTTLNVYSNSGAGYLGWAYYPKIVLDPHYRDLDGAVIHFDSMPGGKIKGFNLGHTATHEVGHWLGLAHTFEGGCNGHGDYVEDTPPQAYPTSGCPEGKDTCPAPGGDPIHNYMDYSTDPCYSEFSAGQVARGQLQWQHWRVEHGY